VDEGTIPFDATMDALQGLVEDRFILVAVYPVTVDYGLSLAEMIKVGKYDWVNDLITAKHFPFTGEGMVELKVQLVHFKRRIESDDAIKEMDGMGLRPLALSELLAFGAKFPEVQREFPIIALGSVWPYRDGDRYIPGLWEDDHERSLSLRWFGSGWDEDCRFAAVRK